jgi:transcription initiation factor TFIIIB Brf1 subunit/transcription initiation factor TFIIB
MSDFTLFKNALTKYNKLCEKTSPVLSKICEHVNVVTEKGLSICVDCGDEIFQKISSDKEWRYYATESKNINESNLKKGDDRSIFKDVENLGFSESIISKANSIYCQVTQGKIFRGDSRKAIVFACIFHAFKISDKPQFHEDLIKIFNLEPKIGLKGLKFVNLHAPKNSNIRTTYISPVALITDIMKKFSATEEQNQEVVEIYDKIRNKSSRLNRSRPQSVASGLVYYWICLKNKGISLKDFAKKVGLSELTINKIAKVISELLDKSDIVL